MFTSLNKNYWNYTWLPNSYYIWHFSFLFVWFEKYVDVCSCFDVKAWLVPGPNPTQFLTQPEVKFHICRELKCNEKYFHIMISCRFHRANEKIFVIYTLTEKQWLCVVLQYLLSAVASLAKQMAAFCFTSLLNSSSVACFRRISTTSPTPARYWLTSSVK